MLCDQLSDQLSGQLSGPPGHLSICITHISETLRSSEQRSSDGIGQPLGGNPQRPKTWRRPEGQNPACLRIARAPDTSLSVCKAFIFFEVTPSSKLWPRPVTCSCPNYKQTQGATATSWTLCMMHHVMPMMLFACLGALSVSLMALCYSLAKRHAWVSTWD